LLFTGGICSALLTLSLFIAARWHGVSDQRAMTMTFVALVLIEFFKAYSFRTGNRHFWKRLWENHWLNLAILWELLLVLLIVHSPLGQRLFATQPLTILEWFVTTAWAAAIIPAIELGKLFNSR
jgi:Ca2+-transporting ATPase